MVSIPAIAATWSVTKPVMPAGSFTVIAVFCPRGNGQGLRGGGTGRRRVTLQPLHCEPKLVPLSVIVVPAVTALPAPWWRAE